MKSRVEYVNIYGINIKNTTLEEVLIDLRSRLDKEELYTIATPNTEIAMEAKSDKYLSRLINSFDLVVPDGIGLIYASKFRKLPLQERVTGYDISMGLLEMSKERPIRLYLLGSKPGHTDKAVDRLKVKYPNVEVVGHNHGYFGLEEEDEIIKDINDSRADIVFVGLGFPKQEEFIQRNKEDIKSKIIIGNGGVIDILAGMNKRAPEIFIKLNLEWFYRLLQEPSRIKRQLALPKFVFNVIIDEKSVMKGDINTNV